MEFKLKKLETSDGFSIKRTITEENSTHISKSSLLYNQESRENSPYLADIKAQALTKGV